MKTKKQIMKTIKLTIAILLFFITTVISAQSKVDNHYGPPVWAPTAPAKVQYYYLPDIQTYYDVPSQQYIYSNNGVWTRSSSLPIRYKTYNLSKGNTVYLSDYKGKTPYVFYKQHRAKYESNKNWEEKDHDNGNHYGNHKEKHKDYENHTDENDNQNGKQNDDEKEDHKGREKENHGNKKNHEKD